jgi:hypothetical protein
MVMVQHRDIYLSPLCMDDPHQGRMWCEDSSPEDCQCIDGPHPWVKYTLFKDETMLEKIAEALRIGGLADYPYSTRLNIAAVGRKAVLEALRDGVTDKMIQAADNEPADCDEGYTSYKAIFTAMINAALEES